MLASADGSLAKIRKVKASLYVRPVFGLWFLSPDFRPSAERRIKMQTTVIAYRKSLAIQIHLLVVE